MDPSKCIHYHLARIHGAIGVVSSYKATRSPTTAEENESESGSFYLKSHLRNAARTWLNSPALWNAQLASVGLSDDVMRPLEPFVTGNSLGRHRLTDEVVEAYTSLIARHSYRVRPFGIQYVRNGVLCPTNNDNKNSPDVSVTVSLPPLADTQSFNREADIWLLPVKHDGHIFACAVFTRMKKVVVYEPLGMVARIQACLNVCRLFAKQNCF